MAVEDATSLEQLTVSAVVVQFKLVMVIESVLGIAQFVKGVVGEDMLL